MMSEDQAKAAINHNSRNCTQKQGPNFIANECHLENQHFGASDSQEGIYHQLDKLW